MPRRRRPMRPWLSRSIREAIGTHGAQCVVAWDRSTDRTRPERMIEPTPCPPTPEASNADEPAPKSIVTCLIGQFDPDVNEDVLISISYPCTPEREPDPQPADDETAT